MSRWIMIDEPPHVWRAAALGTVTLLLLGLILGVAAGAALAMLVEAAHLDEIAGELGSPAAAGQVPQR